MKRFFKRTGLMLVVFACLITAFNGCRSLKEFYTFPPYKSDYSPIYEKPVFDVQKKTVLIIADNNGTELFDMMAPFYLFNATEKANVWLVAKEKQPIVTMKGLFVLPHFSFKEIDSMHLVPDVVVVPALSAMNREQQDTVITSWIKQLNNPRTTFLSICQGALTMAATGLYNGKPMTTHASELERNKKEYSKPLWVKDVAYTVDENMYSTAGVSNAVNGCLVVIKKLFGALTAEQIMEKIRLQQRDIPVMHNSIAIGTKAKLKIARKLFLGSNKRVGVWLSDGVDELTLAGILDTYYRTFPRSIKSFSNNNKPIQSAFGMTIFPTGDIKEDKVDEWHIPDAKDSMSAWTGKGKQPLMIRYATIRSSYIMDECLQRIAKEYGLSFEQVVRLILDYN